MARVLIIDDDEQLCGVMGNLYERLGLGFAVANTLESGLAAAQEGRFDVVLLDVNLPDGNGLKAIPGLKRSPGEPEVVIITGEGDPDGAELAIASGAWDYLEKTANLDRMSLALIRCLEYRAEKRRRQPLKLPEEMVAGADSKLQASLEPLAQAAGSDCGVLLTGETGVGKETFALAIHRNSRRAAGPFVVVDCAALPESLIESLLFGHERGAFTGADRAREGLIRQAHGGTLFLDEVGELPLPSQKAFLRVLQERRFRPVGGSVEAESDFRVIAATNRDLDGLVRQGQFRQDLLFRLRALSIHLPPLRERKGDLNELVTHHLTKLYKHYGLSPKVLSPDFIGGLQEYPWPGNIRELFHALDSALATAGDEGTLCPKHLPNNIRVSLAKAVLAKPKERPPVQPSLRPAPTLPKFREYRDQALARIEIKYLKDLMAEAKGKVKLACEISGLSKPYLYQLLSKYKADMGG